MTLIFVSEEKLWHSDKRNCFEYPYKKADKVVILASNRILVEEGLRRLLSTQPISYQCWVMECIRIVLAVSNGRSHDAFEVKLIQALRCQLQYLKSIQIPVDIDVVFEVDSISITLNFE